MNTLTISLFIFLLSVEVLAAGQNSEIPETKSTSGLIPAQVTRDLHDFTGFVGIGYGSASSLSFDNASVDGFPGFARYEIQSAPSVEVGFMRTFQKSWGYSGLINYEPGMRMTSYSGEFDGFSQNFSLKNAPRMTLGTLAMNAIYTVDKFYVPLGLNLTTATISSDALKTELSNGVGFQMGVGYLLNEHLAFNFQFLRRQIDYTEKYFSRRTSSEVTYKYGAGLIDSFQLNVRMLF